MNKNRLIWIDAMRAFCALYIVGYWHLDIYCPSHILTQKNDFAYQTTFCVLATFTLISGFFAASNSLDSLKDIISFYKKKIIRIYPLFTVAGILFVLAGYNDISTFIRCQLGIGLFIRPFPWTLWFVCMLLLFFLITPFVLLRNGRKSILAFAVFEVAFYILNHRFGIDERFVYYWIFFYIGLVIRKNNYHILINKNYIPLSAISFAVYLITSISIGNTLNIYTIACAMSFIYTLASISYFLFGRKQRERRIIEFISYSSMCAYLFHRPIYFLLQQIFGNFSLVLAYVVCLPTVLIVSFLIQTVYDKLIVRPR